MAAPANEQAFLSALHPTDHECALCYEDFTEEHPPVVLDNCRHVFGKECLEKWVQSDNAQRNKCPTCRAILFGNEQGQPPRAQPTQPADDDDDDEAPTLEEIDTATNDIYTHFLSTLPDPTSFHRKLWRRVSQKLAPLYRDSNKLITPGLDSAARTVLIDLLRRIRYVAQPVEFDLEHLLELSLGGNEMARMLTRRLMQWVMCMVMLSPIVPMEIGIIQGCFDLIPDLYHTLGFEIVNAAVARPTVRNAPIFQVMTMLLVDNDVERVCVEIGQQWYVSGRPSDAFVAQAARVKAKLNRESRSKKDLYRRLKMPREDIVQLWQLGEEVAPPGIRERLRSLFGQDNTPREARRVLTRPPRPTPRRNSEHSPRVDAGLLVVGEDGRVNHERRVQVHHHRGRSVNFTLFTYRSRRYG